MLNLDLLRQMLVIAIALSTITCAFIQKTKVKFKKSTCLCIYSLILNLLLGILFCNSFTNVSFPASLWVGLFSFIGADTIYKSLEGKLASHSDIINKNIIEVPKENLIETDVNT